MSDTIRFLPPTYEGARRLLMCGQIEAGAVFPPVGNLPWVWRLWIGGRIDTINGCAKSELAAKNACLAALEDWLRKAGLGVAK